MQVLYRASTRRPLRPEKCPYIAEIIEANAVSYGDVLSSIVFPNSSVRKRLPHLIENHPSSFWQDGSHITQMNLLHNRLDFLFSKGETRCVQKLHSRRLNLS